MLLYLLNNKVKQRIFRLILQTENIELYFVLFAQLV
jgi:hypothetical protein